MLPKWIAFRVEEKAQDLIEYTLLLGFVALAAVSLFIGSGNSIAGVWTTGNSTLVAADRNATGAGAQQPQHHHDGDGGGGDGDGGH